MKRYRYPDEVDGELVYKEITEEEILNQFHGMHDRILNELGRGDESTKQKTIDFFVMTHLAQEIK